MFEIIHENWVTIFRFPARLDTQAISELEDQIIEDVAINRNNVVFDLAGVIFVSSMFLRVCLKVYQKLGPGKTSIENTTPEIRNVFIAAGFDKYISM